MIKPRLLITTTENQEIELNPEIEEGTTLLSIIRKHNTECSKNNIIEIEAACSGAKVCSTCGVDVNEGYNTFEEPDIHEEDTIDLIAEASDATRLSCNLVFNKDCDGKTFKIKVIKSLRSVMNRSLFELDK